VTGDPRSNESPFLLSINIIWIRWHNHIVDQLSARHHDWSGMRKFEEARRWLIATQQHVITNEWLPHLLGRPLPKYHGYDPMLNPQASDLFSSIGTRYLLTLVPAVIRVQQLINCRSRSTVPIELRLCNTYFVSERLFAHLPTAFFDELIVALLNHAAEQADHRVIDDLRLFHYGDLDFTRRDGIADALQSAREQGIPSYLNVRRALNLTSPDSFEQLFATVWSSVDSVRSCPFVS
jgi:hypothetical protein